MNSFKMGDTVSVPRHKRGRFIRKGFIIKERKNNHFSVKTISYYSRLDYCDVIPQSELVSCRLLLIEKFQKFQFVM